MFYARKLRRNPDDPLLGQYNPPPPTVKVNGEQEWEVEKILGVRLVRKTLKYRVQWVGFDVDLDEYTADALKYTPHALRDFHKANPELPGPPQNLEY